MPPRHRRSDWAATVGHRRVWLPDRVVDVAGALVPAEPVQSTCGNCYTTWEDSSPSFWQLVRRAGRFASIRSVTGSRRGKVVIAAERRVFLALAATQAAADADGAPLLFAGRRVWPEVELEGAGTSSSGSFRRAC